MAITGSIIIKTCNSLITNFSCLLCCLVRFVVDVAVVVVAIVDYIVEIFLSKRRNVD